MFIFKNIMLVGLGGMAGSIARYLLNSLAGTSGFPYGTLSVNLIGSFFIGVLAGLLNTHNFGNEGKLLLATGFCGGFTTFSALSLECMQMLQQQKYLPAATYITCSIVLGIAAAFAGFYISRS